MGKNLLTWKMNDKNHPHSKLQLLFMGLGLITKREQPLGQQK